MHAARVCTVSEPVWLFPDLAFLPGRARIMAILRWAKGVSLSHRRADLIRILHDALPPGTVRFAAGLDGIRDGIVEGSKDGAVDGIKDASDRLRVTVGGATEVADLLIGADGVQSRVRSFVQPHVTPRYAGYVAWRGIASGLPGAGAGRAIEQVPAYRVMREKHPLRPRPLELRPIDV